MNSPAIEFVKVDIGDAESIGSALKIYSDSFPLNEQQSMHSLKKRIADGLNLLYAGRINSEIVFIALLWPLKNTEFILLDYMATKEEHRGKNIGSSFLRKMRRDLNEMNKHFIIEIENPLFGKNTFEREKRLSFYKNNGAKEISGLRYVLPALHGDEPTEMILMIFPDYPGGKISMQLVRNLITQIYKELYSRDESDPFIKSLFHENRIELHLK